jgi:hypothetical protein
MKQDSSFDNPSEVPLVKLGKIGTGFKMRFETVRKGLRMA